MDSDVDGYHIVTLLLTFFYRQMKELIERGHVYVGMSPLYKVVKNRKVFYTYDENEQKKLLSEIGDNGLSIQRYKGLGEMSADELFGTTIDPENRYMKKVSLEDAAIADQMFSILMGEEVEPRREFIMKHAKEAELDV